VCAALDRYTISYEVKVQCAPISHRRFAG